jgi:hypothetical protein
MPMKAIAMTATKKEKSRDDFDVLLNGSSNIQFSSSAKAMESR